MSYLIHINEKTNEVLHPEVLQLCDSFVLLNNNEMMYVVLFTDYNSIYAQHPEHERKRKAMWHAFNENEKDLIESPRITNAIKDYMSLQYNPKIDLIVKFQKKIDKMLELLEVDDTPTGIKKITEAVKDLRENIASLQNQVADQFKKDGVIKGDRQLSFLEKIMQNRKLYLSVTEKK